MSPVSPPTHRSYETSCPLMCSSCITAPTLHRLLTCDPSHQVFLCNLAGHGHDERVHGLAPRWCYQKAVLTPEAELTKEKKQGGMS